MPFDPVHSSGITLPTSAPVVSSDAISGMSSTMVHIAHTAAGKASYPADFT